MSSTTLQPLPPFRPPGASGRTFNVALCIVLAHALLLWGWLMAKVAAEPRQALQPLLVSLMEAAQPLPEPHVALPTPAALPRPTLPPLPAPVLVSVNSEVAAPAAAEVVAASEVAPRAAPPSSAITAVVTPPPPAQPTPPQQIPPSAVQYLEPPRLVYPRASIRNGERGRVTVRVFIDIHGWPQQVEVAQSSGYVRLDEAAVAAVRQARFKPYRLDGVPVAGWALVPADFG